MLSTHNHGTDYTQGFPISVFSLINLQKIQSMGVKAEDSASEFITKLLIKYVHLWEIVQQKYMPLE